MTHSSLTPEAARAYIRSIDPGPAHPELDPQQPDTMPTASDTAAAIRAAVSLGALDELPDLVADVAEISGDHEAVLAAEQRAREALQALERAALELAAALEAIADAEG